MSLEILLFDNPLYIFREQGIFYMFEFSSMPLTNNER